MQGNVDRKQGSGGVKCEDCGRVFSANDVGEKWERCHFCGAPVCFDCVHYVGARVRGLYEDYLDVRRACRKCYPKRR